VADRPPIDAGELVHRLGNSPPFQLLDVVRRRLVGVDRIEAVNLLLVDYAEELLSPFDGYQGPPLGRERVDQGLAGSAYRTQATRVGRVQLGWRACVPVSLGAERLGVLDVQLRAEPSPALIDVLGQATVAMAFALVAARRSSDEVELARRGRPLSLPAEMQWELLPGLAFEAAEYSVAGTVEPAYEVGGDLFDYAWPRRCSRQPGADPDQHPTAEPACGTPSTGRLGQDGLRPTAQNSSVSRGGVMAEVSIPTPHGQIPTYVATPVGRDRSPMGYRAAARLERALTAVGVDHDVRCIPTPGMGFLNDPDPQDATPLLVVLSKLSGSRYHQPSAEDARRRIVAFFDSHLKS
jgi:hypothetical protein